MIPKRVTLENFLSFGPKQEIAFDDGEPLWVVDGPNGVGKSAVFDAITFCLFGAHRGGAKETDPLVRHGANGFSVSFEFEFAGIDYRIVRNRTGKSPTQSVESLRDGQWRRVPNVNSVDGVKKWAEETLGLGFDAFQASVLLRQGHADKILTAGAKERGEILRKIIGADRYKHLSDRVHTAAMKRTTTLEDLQARRGAIPDVTAEQVAEAQLAADAAEEAKELAEREKAHAAERVTFAKQWATHEAARRGLLQKLADADARAADAERIQTDHARLAELGRVLPTLKQLVPLRDSLGETEAEATALERQHATAGENLERLKQQIEAGNLAAAVHRDAAGEHGRKAKQLRDTADGRTKFLTAAEDVAKLDAKAAKFSPTLDADAATLRTMLAEGTANERQSRDARTEANTLLKQATKDQTRFDTIAVGVECSRCGQVVTAEHAANERADVEARIQQGTDRFAAATMAWDGATASLASTTEALAAVTKAIQDRDAVRQKIATQRKTLEEFGGTSDAVALRRELADLTAAAEKSEQARDAERAKQAGHEAELAVAGPKLKPLEKQVRDLAARLQTARQKFTADGATFAALSGQLPPEWAATTATELQAYAREHQTLAASGVAELFKLWQQDVTLREEWAEQLRKVAAQADDIPETARVPASEAERFQAAAADAAKQADTAFGTARDELADRTRQAAALAKLKEQIATAETDVRVHDRLDDLLGKKNLQRELIRTAETEIVRLANDTVRNLSGGDLSIELDPAEDADEAFALKVRREGSPPIDVAYLSGSQKFRVAVAVALAIGRFAAGQARPLECVIIDEGFGSLDKDGLQATADELNNLKQHLRRIILVSHQEDFTSHFPVAYRLSKGEHGTIAEKERRG